MVILSFFAGSLIMLAGIFFGLKWQIQVEKKEIPTIIDHVMSEKKELGLTPELMQEWFEGEQKEGET